MRCWWGNRLNRAGTVPPPMARPVRASSGSTRLSGAHGPSAQASDADRTADPTGPLRDHYNTVRPPGHRPARAAQTFPLAPRRRPEPPRSPPAATIESAITASTRRAAPAALPQQAAHMGIGRAHAGIRVLLLVNDLAVRVLSEDGELMRHLILDHAKDYELRGRSLATPVQDVSRHNIGGDDGTRTHDPLLAKQMSPRSPPACLPQNRRSERFFFHLVAHCSALLGDAMRTLSGL